MDFKFAPKVIKGMDGQEIDNPFDGHLKLKILPLSRRTKLVKAMSYAMNEKGEIDLDKKLEDDADKIENMVKLVKRQCSEVKLKRKSNGYEFSDIDTLEYDDEGCVLIVNAASALLNGVRLGEA